VCGEVRRQVEGKPAQGKQRKARRAHKGVAKGGRIRGQVLLEHAPPLQGRKSRVLLSKIAPKFLLRPEQSRTNASRLRFHPSKVRRSVVNAAFILVTIAGNTTFHSKLLAKMLGRALINNNNVAFADVNMK